MRQEIMLSVEESPVVRLGVSDEIHIVGGGTSDYSELSNKPQINGITLEGDKSASDLGLATPSDVAAKYTKPSGGIPKADLASDVQTSLNKADTALQTAPVTSVNGQTGEVNIAVPSTASDVGAVSSDQGVGNAGKFLVVGNDGVVAPVTVPSASGVEF